MDYNERFGQIEAMLADLRRRMDRWDQQQATIIGIPKTTDEQPTCSNELKLHVSAFETRMRRLEDAVFNKAS